MVPMRVSLLAPLILLCGCTEAPPPGPEPLNLPADPAAPGVPVGVRTLETAGVTFEVWYPAPDAAAGRPGDTIDLSEFVPANVDERLGGVTLPTLVSTAVRDADLRAPESPYPVIVFSHGFGGFRTQSVSITTHLASRGYVVLAADHPGRQLGNALPCLFSPALDGCDLSQFNGVDPAPPHVEALLDWVATANADGGGVFAGALDVGRIGMTGHSAGGFTTTRMGPSDPRIDAILPMAGADVVLANTPTLFLAGSCDTIFTLDDMVEAFDAQLAAGLVNIRGAGHLAFSDMCSMELGAFAEEHLEGRDDLNGGIYGMMFTLGIDGCPGWAPEPPPSEECDGGWLDLAVSDPIVRHYSTAFFDSELLGAGPGVQGGLFAEVELR